MHSIFRSVFTLLATLGLGTFASLASAGTAGTVTLTYGPLGSSAVPTLSGTMLIALAVLLLLVAFRLLKDRPGAGTNLVLAITAIAALASGAGGIKLISDAQAIQELAMADVEGGTIVVEGTGNFPVINSTDVPLQVKAIEYAPNCGPEPFNVPAVLALNGGSSIGACAVSTTLAPLAAEYCELPVFCDFGG